LWCWIGTIPNIISIIIIIIIARRRKRSDKPLVAVELPDSSARSSLGVGTGEVPVGLVTSGVAGSLLAPNLTRRVKDPTRGITDVVNDRLGGITDVVNDRLGGLGGVGNGDVGRLHRITLGGNDEDSRGASGGPGRSDDEGTVGVDGDAMRGTTGHVDLMWGVKVSDEGWWVMKGGEWWRVMKSFDGRLWVRDGVMWKRGRKGNGGEASL
jgi:hypothetical protein